MTVCFYIESPIISAYLNFSDQAPLVDKRSLFQRDCALDSLVVVFYALCDPLADTTCWQYAAQDARAYARA